MTTRTWIGLALGLAVLGFGDPAAAADLKVMKIGLGSGTVTGTGINCGIDCDETYPGGSVTLTIMTPLPPGSSFVGWQGDCAAAGAATTCTLTMSANRAVRAEFGLTTAIPTITDFTPDGPPGSGGRGGIRAYLSTNTSVDTAGKFVAALPADFRQNWILMTRSESLQTGVAQSPRILLPGADSRSVFSIGAATHASYPGADPRAIEYMQWDPNEKNFRFHEIIVANIPDMGGTITLPDGTTRARFPARTRGITIDDFKCTKCHSTRNVPNTSASPGTTGIPPGSVPAKNKPNWDAYDSWGGMMPFNRDRIYQGSVEEAAFKGIFNLWNWRNSDVNDATRQILEQLQLQPAHVTSTSPHRVVRNPDVVTNSGHIAFGFDGIDPGTTSASTTYSFDLPAAGASTFNQGGRYVTLRHSNPDPPPSTTNDNYTDPGSDEGRAVEFFDLLGGSPGMGRSNLNAQRIADELINHRFATGSVPIDVKALALAITRSCFSISGTTVSSTPALTIDLSFFNARNGMTVDQVFADTTARAQSLPRRKADIQKRNFDRSIDPYLFSPGGGLIPQYTGATPTLNGLRQEVFRRPRDLGIAAVSIPGNVYVDRERYTYHTQRIALFRYFLEPLGVSVDKWSMSVRGRSRAYNFADVFGAYEDVLVPELGASLVPTLGPIPSGGYSCATLIGAINGTPTLTSLPAADAVPTFTDVQRIFNKSCIECHGGLGYPPYGTGSLDFSEDELLTMGTRLGRSHANASGLVTPPPPGSPPGTPLGYLFNRITRTNEDCPSGLMPCGGPSLSQVDIETIRRWIIGGAPDTVGDPHLKTIGGVSYDFQSAGEFVLLRGENVEVQTRQTPVGTDGPLPPNAYTGLASCVSVNTAAAVRVGRHRITYQPNLSGEPDPSGMQLRIDGELTKLGSQGVFLAAGGRITPTTAPGGIQIEAPGGTLVVITPGWWEYYRIWYLNIDVRNARETEGLMGAIAPRNWLPALPDGTFMGPRPEDLHQRYLDFYGKFADAWRVTDASSLFHYAPGTSTTTFTNRNWPAENPKTCVAPPPAPGSPEKPPAAVTLEVARQQCAALVADDRRANCVLDVMASGEAGFAKTYLAAQKIAQNAAPAPPVLVFPWEDKGDVAPADGFQWKRTLDKDGDPVTYRTCAWVAGERFTYTNCDAASVPAPWWRSGFGYAGLAGLAVFLLLMILIFTALKQKRILLAAVALAILFAVVLAFYAGRTAPLSKTLARLQPGKAYLWKVIAEDDKGAYSESETRRFTVK